MRTSSERSFGSAHMLLPDAKLATQPQLLQMRRPPQVICDTAICAVQSTIRERTICELALINYRIRDASAPIWQDGVCMRCWSSLWVDVLVDFMDRCSGGTADSLIIGTVVCRLLAILLKKRSTRPSSTVPRSPERQTQNRLLPLGRIVGIFSERSRILCARAQSQIVRSAASRLIKLYSPILYTACRYAALCAWGRIVAP